jgi:transposase
VATPGRLSVAINRLARRSKDPGQFRRLLAVAEIYEDRSRGEATRGGGVGCKRCASEAPEQPPKLNDARRQQLLHMVETGPTPAIHGVVRWRLIDLAQGLFEEYGLSIAKQTLSREMRALGLRRISARPRHHAQDLEQAEAFTKTSPPVWQRLPRQGRRTPR